MDYTNATELEKFTAKIGLLMREIEIESGNKGEFIEEAVNDKADFNVNDVSIIESIMRHASFLNFSLF